MNADPLAWCPQPARSALREAGIGLPNVTLYRVGDRAWAAIRRKGGRVGAVSALFALGHHSEVLAEQRSSRVADAKLKACFSGVTPVHDALVAHAVPILQWSLAKALGVDAWGTAPVASNVNGKRAWMAIGYARGLPMCVIAPLDDAATLLAPEGLS